jgi:hypothetical protein
MADFLVLCRGTKCSISRVAASRSPALSAMLASKSPPEIDRCPVLFAAILRYCESGVFAAQDIARPNFLAEADFWGIAPQHSMGLPPVFSESREDLCYDAALLVERMIRTDQGGASGDPVLLFLLPCERYMQHTRWEEKLDVFKFVQGHPDLLRTIAFTTFGIALAWEIVDVDVTIEGELHGIWYILCAMLLLVLLVVVMF